MVEAEAATTTKRAEFKAFQPMLVYAAMAKHASQFVWYRKLSVAFSRYTYFNEFRRVQTMTRGKRGQGNERGLGAKEE